MGAGEFKAKCLAVLDEVADSRREVVITKRGKPVARLVPVAKKRRAPIEDLIAYQEDLVSPVDVAWDAEK